MAPCTKDKIIKIVSKKNKRIVYSLEGAVVIFGDRLRFHIWCFCAANLFRAASRHVVFQTLVSYGFVASYREENLRSLAMPAGNGSKERGEGRGWQEEGEVVPERIYVGDLAPGRVFAKTRLPRVIAVGPSPWRIHGDLRPHGYCMGEPGLGKHAPRPRHRPPARQVLRAVRPGERHSGHRPR